MQRGIVALVTVGFIAFWLVHSAPLAHSVHTIDSIFLNKQDINYLPLGDSFTIGAGLPRAQNWPHQLADRLQQYSSQKLVLVAEPAMGGYTAKDLIDHELMYDAKYQPDLITIEIGTNDIESHVPLLTFQKQLDYIIDTIQQQDPSAQVLLMTIPDMSLAPKATIFGTRPELHTKVKLVNSIIEKAGKRYDLQVADIYGVSQAVAHDPSLLAHDQFHPSIKGYAAWVDVVSKLLLRLPPHSYKFTPAANLPFLDNTQ
jgi:acyl-CoA thioesterase-1